MTATDEHSLAEAARAYVRDSAAKGFLTISPAGLARPSGVDVVASAAALCRLESSTKDLGVCCYATCEDCEEDTELTRKLRQLDAKVRRLAGSECENCEALFPDEGSLDVKFSFF